MADNYTITEYWNIYDGEASSMLCVMLQFLFLMLMLMRACVCVCVRCGEKPKAIMNRIRYVPIKWIPCQKRFLNSNCFSNPLFPRSTTQSFSQLNFGYRYLQSSLNRVIEGFSHFRREKERKK